MLCRPPGTPEQCPLGNNLFADLEQGIRLCAASTSSITAAGGTAEGGKKFRMGTPAEATSTITRVWEHYPSSGRIVQDIERSPAVLDKIIEARGAGVPELDNRHGRRETRKYLKPRLPRRLHDDCRVALAEREAKWAELGDAPWSSAPPFSLGGSGDGV